MNNKLIAFISSDYRELYKDDIYRTLALPEKSTIHFRYDPKWINMDLVDDPESLRGKEGVIFFLIGTSNDSKTENRLISTRKVIIKKVEQNSNTSRVHFFLEMGEFCDTEFKWNDGKYVTSFSSELLKTTNWINRVRSLQNYFEHAAFFNFQIYNDQEKEVLPVFDDVLEDDSFEFLDKTIYFIKLSLYDPKEGISEIETECSETLKLLFPNKYQSGSELDDLRFKFTTTSIQRPEESGYLKIGLPGTNRQVRLLARIKKSWGSTFKFGSLAGLSLLALLASQFSFASFRSGEPIIPYCMDNWVTLLFAGIACAVFAFCAGCFYREFNKK